MLGLPGLAATLLHAAFWRELLIEAGTPVSTAGHRQVATEGRSAMNGFDRDDRGRPLVANLARTTLLAVACASLAGCGLLLPSAGVDFSGWTAVPTTPDPAFEARGRERCIDPFPDHRSELDGAKVLHDQRGPNGASIVWYTDRYDASTFVYRTTDGELQAPGCGYADHGEGISPPEELRIGPWGSGAVSGTEGEVDPAAARVMLETESGRMIEASVADGRFLAWWPYDDLVAVARSYDADGELLAEASRPMVDWPDEP
ncbi:MAG: hypothetical protein U0667_09520 [Chloroflexota bacterium]